MKYLSLLVFLISANILTAQWSEQTSPVTTALRSVSSVNSTTVWTCGASGVVLKTTNMGTVWQNVSGGGIPNTVTLINIVGLDANTALVTGYSGTPSTTWVWKTTNGGTNWNQVFTQSAGGFIDVIIMNSATNGILVGDPIPAGVRWTLFKTTNAGTTWDSTGMFLPPSTSAEAGWNNSGFCISPYMWFGTNNSKVYYSTNNGTTWAALSTGTEVNTYAMSFYQFSSLYYGFAGGANLLSTTNSGNNWNQRGAPGAGNFSGISTLLVPMIQGAWYVRNGSSVIERNFTNDSNWTQEYTASAGTYWHISAGKPGVGWWAVRSNGGISYRQPIMDIKNISSETPGKYSLSQNYPNPFNPTTNIRYQITNNSFVSLKIFDIQGTEIATLVNNKQTPGTYEVSFDGSTYSSGVYFYTLSTRDFKETKRMILVK